MFGLIVAILIFNALAFLINKRLTKNQIIHIWTFTIIYQLFVDLYLGYKSGAYGYFDSEISWAVVIPPVNIIFINWYPFHSNKINQIIYIVLFSIFCVVYEAVVLLPEPWGYFFYGWWKLSYSAVLYPFLLFTVIIYYKWICKVEKEI